MRHHFLLFFILFILSPFVSFAQIDSLIEELNQNGLNKKQVQQINELIQASLYKDPKGVLNSSERLDSILNQTSALFEIAETKNSLGLALYVNQRFDDAIDQLLESIRIFEELNIQSKIARLSNSLAIVYQVRKESETSAIYWEQALSIYEDLNDSLWIANVASNLGGHYMEHDQLKKADALFARACPIFEALNRPGMLGYAKLNQGSMRVKQRRYAEAIQSFDKTFELIPYEANPLIHAVAHTGRGNAYLELGRMKKAQDDLQQGYDISKSIGQYEQQVPASKLLSRYYEVNREFKKSLQYFKESAILQDSFLTKEEDARVVDALKKYETEKKEQEIHLLSAENEIKDLLLQKNNRNLIFAIIGLFGLSIFVYYFYRSRQKANLLNKALKEQKETISKSLLEKEFLLKEIHHRVKNNLQVISSLLKLQSRSVTDQKAQQALNEGRSRVRSMALIHQNLYQDDCNPGGINIRDYIHKLSSELLETYKIDRDKVTLHLEIEDLLIDVDTAVPMGLILNELISNSFKHAFPSGTSGKILIQLYHTAGGTLHLEYTDDGIGYNERNIDANSFGLRLINAFANRLDAEYDIKGTNGSNAVFEIKDYKLAA